MLSMTETAREARVRRLAARQDLKVVKSRCRTPEHPVHGTYGIIDPWYNAWRAMRGGDGYGMSLDDIEAWLTSE